MTKIAVVTGASRGFGRGIAFVLATEANYKVYVTARNKVALTKLKEEVDSAEEGQMLDIYPGVLTGGGGRSGGRTHPLPR